MHDYSKLRRSHGSKISQTLDSPIMFADFWELSDIMLCLASILIFGLLFYSWKLLMISILWTLVVNPKIKKKSNRGILLHWPYRVFGLQLKGLMNPKGNKQYSD